MSIALIRPRSEREGIGLKVDGSAHNLAELLAIWQPLCDDETIYKQFALGHHASCEGCLNNCCRTAYVTPDLVALKAVALLHGVDLAEAAQLFLDQEKLAMGIPKLKTPCSFLSGEWRCLIYEARTLLCRFYLCSPLDPGLTELIHRITAVGVAAARQVLLEIGLGMPEKMGGMSSFDLLILEEITSLAGHPGVQFFLRANSYADIPLDVFMTS